MLTPRWPPVKVTHKIFRAGVCLAPGKEVLTVTEKKIWDSGGSIPPTPTPSILGRLHSQDGARDRKSSQRAASFHRSPPVCFATEKNHYRKLCDAEYFTGAFGLVSCAPARRGAALWLKSRIPTRTWDGWRPLVGNALALRLVRSWRSRPSEVRGAGDFDHLSHDADVHVSACDVICCACGYIDHR
jgi:hypothetical protein